jgi:hypothetical protein
MRFNLFILFMTASIIACGPQVDPAKVEKVNALQSRIDSSKTEFAKVDSTKGVGSAMEYDFNVQYLKTEYKDTVSEDIARFVDKYYSIRKAMKLIRSTYARTAMEIRTTDERLDNLMHDLENGLIEEEQFQQYHQLESNNVAMIEESVGDIVYAYETVQPLYDEMTPRIDSLIQTDKRENGKPSE